MSMQSWSVVCAKGTRTFHIRRGGWFPVLHRLKWYGRPPVTHKMSAADKRNLTFTLWVLVFSPSTQVVFFISFSQNMNTATISERIPILCSFLMHRAVMPNWSSGSEIPLFCPMAIVWLPIPQIALLQCQWYGSSLKCTMCYASWQPHVEVEDTYSEGGTHEEMLRPQSKTKIMNKGREGKVTIRRTVDSWSWHCDCIEQE